MEAVQQFTDSVGEMGSSFGFGSSPTDSYSMSGNGSTVLTIFRVVLPTFFIAIFETALFLTLTRRDINTQVERQYKLGNDMINETIETMSPQNKLLARDYITNVHLNIGDKLSKVRKLMDRENTKAIVNAIIIVLMVFIFLIGLFVNMALNDVAIPWADIAFQTTATVIGIASFIVYFYFSVGSKYGYISGTEIESTILKDVNEKVFNV